MFFPGMMYGPGFGMGPMGYGGMGPMGYGGMGGMGGMPYNAGMAAASREEAARMRQRLLEAHPELAPPKEQLVLIRRSFEKAEMQPGKVVVLYFASGDTECKGFTSTLRKFHEHLRSTGKPVEIIYVSSEKSEVEFRQTFTKEHGEWLAVAWSSTSWREGMTKQYDVRQVPELIVVNDKGDPVRRGAVQDVRSCASSREQTLAMFATWRSAVGDEKVDADAVIPKPADLRAARLAALERRGGQAGDAAAATSSDSAQPNAGQAASAPAGALPGADPPAAFPSPNEPGHGVAAPLLGAEEQQSTELDPMVRRMRLEALDRARQREGDKRDCCVCAVQ